MISAHHIRQAVERTRQALIVAEHKPSPRGESGGGGSVVPPLPLPVGLISAKRELRDWLLDWCDLVKSGLDIIRTYDLTETAMLEWLGTGERAEFLAGHETAMDFLDELTAITRSLESPYLNRPNRKYIGNHGGGAVFIREGQRTVELADGTEVPVIDINNTNTDMILSKTGTALQVSRIIKAYFKFDLDPKKIKDAERYDRKKTGGTKLEHVRIDDGAYVYKVEDVLNRMCSKEISPKT